ncbi:MAG: nucleotidyltransferase domain-containing protein [Caldilineales bacterium]|nr:nucleotidyltransferase domain-containing protein [Caldilineales bacterium]MCW5860124.1 nucleotidyltransferase domain-containing protein [Caldilineales bacterium]
MDQTTAVKLAQGYLNMLKNNDISFDRAYLFGSYAKGDFDDDSDIDLGIAMSNLENSFLMQMELMKWSANFDSRIEPHPFSSAEFDDPTPFVAEILNTGIPLV